MPRPSCQMLLRMLCAGAMLFGATATSQACLFPCLFGHWGGWGGYGAYYSPAYPTYAPSYGSPCGAGGCGSYYRPINPCCSPCSVGCSPCGVGNCGVGACGSGGCATGNCGVNYIPDQGPIPDAESNRPPHPTYAEENARGPQPQSTDDMPDDDFGAPRREGTGAGPDTNKDPFHEPVPPTTDVDAATPSPLADDQYGDIVTLRISPVRCRVRAEARYRLPRVARLQVTPQSPWIPVSGESRVATK